MKWLVLQALRGVENLPCGVLDDELILISRISNLKESQNHLNPLFSDFSIASVCCGQRFLYFLSSCSHHWLEGFGHANVFLLCKANSDNVSGFAADEVSLLSCFDVSS